MTTYGNKKYLHKSTVSLISPDHIYEHLAHNKDIALAAYGRDDKIFSYKTNTIKWNKGQHQGKEGIWISSDESSHKQVFDTDKATVSAVEKFLRELGCHRNQKLKFK